MRKLMVVDDEEIIRNVVRDIVSMYCDDVFVETACSGEEAIEKLRGGRFDLVFLDMKMKTADGLDTYRRMVEINPEQKVFIVTGYLDEERNKQAVREGACGTIYKPFKVDDITDVIERYAPRCNSAGKV